MAISSFLSFLNNWAACYREEISGLVEHPMPALGFDNGVPFKTSDQANAMMWLTYMYVYVFKNNIHFGRAIPRYWLSDGNSISAEGIATPYGKVTIKYNSQTKENRITALVDLSELRKVPNKIVVRFRHPNRKPISYVSVNGKAHEEFDSKKGDVYITGYNGMLKVIARYQE